MSPEYKAHAYARTILQDMQQHLLDRFISAETPAKAKLLCEEVFYADREVPQEALRQMLARLRRMEEQESLRMSEFETRRRTEPDEPPKEVTHEAKGQAKTKRKGASE